MSGFSPYQDSALADTTPDGELARYAAFYDDYDDEPTEAERVEAVEQFLADGGRFPGVADELDRARQAEIESDYSMEAPAGRRPARREPAGIEL